MQNILVYITLAVVALYVVVTLRRTLHKFKENKSECDGCSGCKCGDDCTPDTKE